MPSHNLKHRFQVEHAQRQDILDRARLAAALTKPWLLPPEDHDPSDKLPENFQSVGSWGLTNIEGKMLVALFPPGQPWFRLRPPADLRYRPFQDQDDAFKQQIHAIEQALRIKEFQIQAVIETANLKPSPESSGKPSTFRTRKRQALSQILATGETLEQITDDYRFRVFRRDQYVNQRDGEGCIRYHIIKERIDPLTLSDEALARANLRRQDLEQKMAFDRLMDQYTYVERQPMTGTWVIRQEVDGREIVVSEEPVSPFINTAYELAPGDNYGRGFVELNMGDLRTLDELEARLLDFAGLHSKQLFARDYSSSVREKDVSKPSGSLIEARVQNGMIDDLAVLAPQNGPSFALVANLADRKTKDIAKAMLIESTVQPQKERVTAEQVRRIAVELDGALGGIYAPIADEQQVPTIQRIVFMMKRDNMLSTRFGEQDVELQILTGLAALSREAKATNIITFMQMVNALPDQAKRRIDYDVLLDLMAEMQGIDRPELIKSAEQVREEDQALQQQALQQQAAQQAIESTGNIAEEAASQQLQGADAA